MSSSDPLPWVEKKMLECRKMALSYFLKPLKVNTKKDNSPVTIADKKIEDYLRKEIGRAFPKDGILGEEKGFTRKKADAYWVIDPIDGTRAFSRGLPSWGILLARVENGIPTIGACDFPALNTTILGVRGKKPYEKIGKQKKFFPKPKKIKSLKEAIIFHGGANYFLSSKYGSQFKKMIKQCYLERAYGDCYAYLWVLRGSADVMLDKMVKEWDIAPFSVFAEGTGRVMVDFNGKPDFKGPNSIFGEPTLVKKIVSTFNK